MHDNDPTDRESTDPELIVGEWPDADHSIQVGGPVREPATDGGPNRREFMAAGVSAAAAGMLPRGQPMDLDAWPSDDEIEPLTDTGYSGGYCTVAEFDTTTRTEVCGPRVTVDIPNVPEESTAIQELFVRYDTDGVRLNINVDVPDADAGGGVVVTVPPATADRLAAALEAGRPTWRHPNLDGESVDDPPAFPVADATGNVVAGLVGVSSDPDDPATIELEEYVEGFYLKLEVESEVATISSTAIVEPERLELAKALRIAAAEWRRWPVTDG